MSRVRERMAISERELQRLAAERQEQESLIAIAASRADHDRGSARPTRNQLVAGQDRSPRCAASATLPGNHLAARRSRGHARRAPPFRHHPASAHRDAGCRGCVSGPALCRSKGNRLAPKLRNGKTRMCNWPSSFVQFEAERNAGEAREGLLQIESEQVRRGWPKLKNCFATRVSSSIWLATAG